MEDNLKQSEKKTIKFSWSDEQTREFRKYMEDYEGDLDDESYERLNAALDKVEQVSELNTEELRLLKETKIYPAFQHFLSSKGIEYPF
ncbi:hypothetical protein [Prevotella disiens]|uniref:hypothetical protein n=1 Tax=Prevotella disiens TaxID=28130 RepID=UPI002432DBC8|nr:hypothetical protein [Prevotella disiens]